MKVYVDGKLHKDCVSCSNLYLNNSDTYSCKLLKEVVGANFSDCMGYKPPNCPIKPLSDYTKQVRKEVCEEIREKICMLAYKSNLDEVFIFADTIKLNKVLEILDQIQGEQNGSKN